MIRWLALALLLAGCATVPSTPLPVLPERLTAPLAVTKPGPHCPLDTCWFREGLWSCYEVKGEVKFCESNDPKASPRVPR